MKKLALLLAAVMLSILAVPAALAADEPYKALFDFSGETARFAHSAGDPVTVTPKTDEASEYLYFWSGFGGSDSNGYSIVAGTASSGTAGYDGIVLRIKQKGGVVALDIGGIRYNNAKLFDTQGNEVEYVQATDQNGVWLLGEFDGYLFFPFSGATGAHNFEATAMSLVFLDGALADSYVVISDFGAYKGTDYAAVIEAIDPAPVDASLSPAEAVFDKASPADVTVTLDPGSYSLTALKNGETTLVKDTDYTVDGNSYTIKADYLASLPEGSAALTFVMDGGVSPALTVAVTDGVPVPASLSVTEAKFDKAKPADVTVTLTSGSYTLTALKNGETTLVKDTDYTIDGNRYTLKASYLASLANGSAALTFVMDGGTNPVLTVAVTDTTPEPSETPELPKTYKEIVDLTNKDVIWPSTAGTIINAAADGSALKLTFDKNNLGAGWGRIDFGLTEPNTSGYDGFVLRVRATEALNLVLAVGSAVEGNELTRYEKPILLDKNGKAVEYVASTDQEGGFYIPENFDGYMFFPFNNATKEHPASVGSLMFLFLNTEQAGEYEMWIDSINAYKGTNYAAVIAEMNGIPETGNQECLYLVSLLAIVSAAALVLLKRASLKKL